MITITKTEITSFVIFRLPKGVDLKISKDEILIKIQSDIKPFINEEAVESKIIQSLGQYCTGSAPDGHIYFNTEKVQIEKGMEISNMSSWLINILDKKEITCNTNLEAIAILNTL